MANQQMINFAASFSSSSSSSFVMPLKKYDVFLSFRGEDTRENFISHLYNALKKEVETYIDYKLEKGDEISQALIKAIQDSHVSVVIFSENYASSKWCLDEISMIIQCKKDDGQIVIPVFYKVDPSHVRKQTESYQKAFAKHEQDLKNSDDGKLQKWRCALTEVANLAGWDSQTYRNDSEFIKDIVKDVLKKLNIRYPIELKGVIGIEENYARIESLLEIGSTEVVRVIGIWGMGGAGKTTLAHALYAKLSYQFEGLCYLKHVREQSEKKGLDYLRNRLFSDLLEEENLHVESHFVLRRLRRKRVLIVLDDVATSKQLEYLMSDYDCLAPGSRVIVTTRDRHLLNHMNGIYQIKELNYHDSLHLFYLNAFTAKCPRIGYENLSQWVVAYCKGNPLFLKVLGARLGSRSIEVWESELRKLRKIPDVNIHSALKLSFDGLDRKEQAIFLDIACFLKGDSRDDITSLLDACDFFATAGIANLIDKSLLTVYYKNTEMHDLKQDMRWNFFHEESIKDPGRQSRLWDPEVVCDVLKYEKIEMHDLIQEMGWEIVHEESIKDPGRRSRLWDAEEVCDVLKYERGTEAVEGIVLELSKMNKDLHLSFNSFTKMPEIRILKFYYEKGYEGCNKIYLPDGLESLPGKLRHLEWHGCCLEFLPSNFCAEKLVKLIMPGSHLKKLWDGVQELVNLKEINLRCSKDLFELPDLSLATSLEVLCLAECISLREVHPSILSLHKLWYLSLEGCTKIESLESEVHLKSLRCLKIKNCSSLKKFSVCSKKLNSLCLDGTSIHEWSSSIWQCEKLEHMSLRNCYNLESFGSNSSHDPVKAYLTHLNLKHKLVNESDPCLIVDTMWSLTTLNLEDCCNLRALPDSIGSLMRLSFLSLSGCINVEVLSPNIKNLLMLRELRLDNCRKLVSLPELPPSLKVLSAINCTSLNLSNFTQWLPLVRDDSICFKYYKYGIGPREYVLVPGAQVPEMFNFRAEGNSITIPHLPQSGSICGFICCLILPHRPLGSGVVKCCINKYIGEISVAISTSAISDHALLCYCQAYCDPNNMPFKFFYHTNDYNIEIKRCGVFLAYTSPDLKQIINTVLTERGYKRKSPSFKKEENSRPEKHSLSSVRLAKDVSHTVKTGFQEDQAQAFPEIKEFIPAGAVSNHHIWKHILNMQDPQIKMLLWKACSGAIPVNSELYKRRIAQEPWCPLCRQEPETISHALLHCSWTRPVWYASQLQLSPSSGAVHDFLIWFMGIVDRLKSNKEFLPLGLSILAQTIWYIWKERNDCCIESRQPNPIAVVMKINAQVASSSMNYPASNHIPRNQSSVQVRKKSYLRKWMLLIREGRRSL